MAEYIYYIYERHHDKLNKEALPKHPEVVRGSVDIFLETFKFWTEFISKHIQGIFCSVHDMLSFT
jgi:hypothetical protein